MSCRSRGVTEIVIVRAVAAIGFLLNLLSLWGKIRQLTFAAQMAPF